MVVGEAWVLRLLVSCDGINPVAWLAVDWQRGGTIKQWQSCHLSYSARGVLRKKVSESTVGVYILREQRVKFL